MSGEMRPQSTQVEQRNHTRRDRRIPTDDPADIYKVNDPYWKTTGRIANISANGLLLNLNSPDDLEPGSKLTVRFGSAAVAGEVRHVSGHEGRTLVGLTIDDVQYL